MSEVAQLAVMDQLDAHERDMAIAVALNDIEAVVIIGELARAYVAGNPIAQALLQG